MYDVEDALKQWSQMVQSTPSPSPTQGFPIEIQQWEPRWRRFRPPMIPIFHWAYKIQKARYPNCVPVSCSTTMDDEVEDEEY